MGLVMRKSITLAKGVRLNLGMTGTSVSFGGKGLRETIHTSGRRTTTVGIPGTGIYYRTSTGGSNTRKPPPQTKQSVTVSAKPNNYEEVRRYEEYINAIKSVHTRCDTPVDWKSISASKEPYNPADLGPRQARAAKVLEAYNPGLFEKMSKTKTDLKRKELSDAVEQAAREDNAEYEDWLNLKFLADRVLDGDIDAYFQVINEMNPLDDLLEYGSDFEFGANDGTAMEVEFRVKPAKVIPTHVLSLTPTGRLSNKDMPKTAYNDLMQDYVCSCAMRIARDMFALLPLEKVVVHAVDKATDASTGRAEEITILSAVYDRRGIEKLDMRGVDPSDALNNFKHNMSFAKTSGFKLVRRIAEY
jgi:hypothetical protein